jgi:HK97 family phage major capsid protein
LGARVMPVIGKQNVPLINDPTATFVSEADVISSGMSQTDPTLAQIEVRPSLVYATTNYAWHVQSFSPADVEQEVKKSFGRALAKAANEKFIVGTGSDQPEGLKACATGVTAASETVFTAAELIALWNSLDPWYQMSSAFIVSPAAATLLRTLESDNGAPLWYANLKDGNNELFGRPVVIDPYMEGLTTSAVPIIVGDVAEAYVIAESPIFFVVDPYSRARHAENVVTAYQFCDGRIRRSTAAKKLVMSDGL